MREEIRGTKDRPNFVTPAVAGLDREVLDDDPVVAHQLDQRVLLEHARAVGAWPVAADGEPKEPVVREDLVTQEHGGYAPVEGRGEQGLHAHPHVVRGPALFGVRDHEEPVGRAQLGLTAADCQCALAGFAQLKKKNIEKEQLICRRKRIEELTVYRTNILTECLTVEEPQNPSTGELMWLRNEDRRILGLYNCGMFGRVSFLRNLPRARFLRILLTGLINGSPGFT